MKGVRLVLLDLLDLLVDLVLKALLDLLERKVFLVRKAPLARPVEMESRVLWVCLARLDLLESLEKTEIRVRLESLVKRVQKEARENMVLLVHLVQWALLVSLVQLVLMVKLVSEVSRDISELKVMKGPGVSQVPQDPSVYRDCLVHQARRERLAMLDLWVLLAHQDPVALLVPMVLMVPKVLLVVWEILDLLERRESLEKLVHLELGESLERRVHEVSVERKEKQASQEQQDPPEAEADRETTGPKETLVLLVSLVILVPLESSDPEVKMGQRVREERMVNKENLALQAPQVRTDPPGPQERGDQLELEDLRVARERRDPRENQVLLDPQERLALSVLKVPPENQAQRVSEDSQDQWVSKDLQDQLDRKDPLDLWALLVCLDFVETLVLKVRRDTQV